MSQRYLGIKIDMVYQKLVQDFKSESVVEIISEITLEVPTNKLYIWFGLGLGIWYRDLPNT